MKTEKLLIRILCGSLILVIVGVVLCAASFISGGRPYSLYSQSAFGISTFGWDSYSHQSNNSKTFHNEAPITSVKIDVNALNIEIVPSDTFSIQTNNVPESYIQTSETNGQYSMDIVDRRITIFNADSRKIIVHVPSTLEELIIYNNLGTVDANNLNLKNFKVEVNAGDIDLQNVTFERGDFKLDLGDFDMLADFSAYCNIRNSAGNADIKLMRTQLDYNYNLKVDLGDLSINDNDFGEIGAEYNQNNNQAATLDVSLNLGDLDIEYQYLSSNNNHNYDDDDSDDDD